VRWAFVEALSAAFGSVVVLGMAVPFRVAREARRGAPLVVSGFVLVAADHFLNTFDYGVDGACGFSFRSPLGSVPDQLGKLFRPCLGQVKPVHGLGEA